MKASPGSSPAASPARRRSRRQLDLQALLVQAVDERWQTYRRELKRCQKHYSEEAVHDLRVATRRLISVLDIVLGLRVDAGLRQARRRLKRHLEMCSPLRDVQVQLSTVAKLSPAFPELQGVAEALAKRERKLVRRVNKEVKAVKTGKLRKVLATTVAEVNALLATPAMQREKRASAIGAVDNAFQTVVERRHAIDPNDMTTIHRTRVAFKKFRYMVEALRPLLHGVTPKQLKAMNAFQDSMGAIQDIEVLLGTLHAFAQKNAETSEEMLERVFHELARQRTALVDSFLPSADALLTFWKPGR
jgi:CHAD domain-containing protein